MEEIEEDSGGVRCEPQDYPENCTNEDDEVPICGD